MTTGRFTTVPGPRIATWGWLMIGVSQRAPTLPRLVIVKVPPDSSSGPILLARVRPATSAIFFARPDTDRSPASLTTGVEQALLGVHGERDVLAVVVGHLAGLEVERGVERRVLLERVDRGLGEERQVGELHAFAGEEVLLRRLAHPGDVGDVDLDHLGELGRDLHRLDHPLGDDLAQPADLDGLAAQRRRRGRRRRASRRLRRQPPDAAEAAGCRCGFWASAASMTSCLRIRPPTPEPLSEPRSTPCWAASLRTSGVT